MLFGYEIGENGTKHYCVGADTGISNSGRKHFLKRKAAAPGRPHTVRCSVSVKIRGAPLLSVSAKIGGLRAGRPPLNPPLLWPDGKQLQPHLRQLTQM